MTTSDECLTALDDPACTLPDADRPVRRDGWHALLGSATIATADGPRTARFEFPADPETAAAVAGLASDEVACCAFFEFGIRVREGGLELRATVPPGHERVVEGLLRLAAS